jgi:hypothetical protein
LPKSATFGVITGSFVKLFTPDAKKRYATMGKIKRTNRTIFFFIVIATIQCI